MPSIQNCFSKYLLIKYIMRAMASQITGVSLVFAIVCSGADQRKYHSSASLALVRGIPQRGYVSIWWRHHAIAQCERRSKTNGRPFSKWSIWWSVLKSLLLTTFNLPEYTTVLQFNNFIQVRNIWYMHYSDVILSAIASQITGISIVYPCADQRKHQISVSPASPHKGPVSRKMFPFDNVIMEYT